MNNLIDGPFNFNSQVQRIKLYNVPDQGHTKQLYEACVHK